LGFMGFSSGFSFTGLDPSRHPAPMRERAHLRRV